MSYHWFNKQEILQKAKEKYSKEKAAKYYTQNKRSYKKKSQESIIKTCHKKKKTRLKSTKERGIKYWFNIKKNREKMNNFFVLCLV